MRDGQGVDLVAELRGGEKVRTSWAGLAFEELMANIGLLMVHWSRLEHHLSDEIIRLRSISGDLAPSKNRLRATSSERLAEWRALQSRRKRGERAFHAAVEELADPVARPPAQPRHAWLRGRFGRRRGGSLDSVQQQSFERRTARCPAHAIGSRRRDRGNGAVRARPDAAWRGLIRLAQPRGPGGLIPPKPCDHAASAPARARGEPISRRRMPPSRAGPSASARGQPRLRGPAAGRVFVPNRT